MVLILSILTTYTSFSSSVLGCSPFPTDNPHVKLIGQLSSIMLKFMPNIVIRFPSLIPYCLASHHLFKKYLFPYTASLCYASRTCLCEYNDFCLIIKKTSRFFERFSLLFFPPIIEHRCRNLSFMLCN